jgi:hypothetical protein
MVGLINFHFSNGMLSLFVDTPTKKDATFRGGFGNLDDVWEFLEGPLLNGLHFETWYDLTNTTENNIGYIFYQNKILGLPRILQLRIKSKSCIMSKAAEKLVGDCLSTYDDKQELQSPFGLGTTTPTPNPLPASWEA